MRKLRRILIVSILMLIGGGGLAWMNLNRLIRLAIVRETTDSLGVTTTAASASLSLRNGRLMLSDFTIDNPPGYSGGKLLDLADAEMDVPLSQLRSRPVHVRRIDFISPRLILERRGGKWNVQAIGHASANPLRLYVDEVSVTDAIVTLNLGLFAGEKPMVMPIPPFTMQNLKASDGSGRGATIKDALLQITRAMTAKAFNPDDLATQLGPAMPFGLRVPLGSLLSPLETLEIGSN